MGHQSGATQLAPGVSGMSSINDGSFVFGRITIAHIIRLGGEIMALIPHYIINHAFRRMEIPFSGHNDKPYAE